MGDWCVSDKHDADRTKTRARIHSAESDAGKRKTQYRPREEMALEGKKNQPKPLQRAWGQRPKVRGEYRIADREVLPLDTEPPNGCPHLISYPGVSPRLSHLFRIIFNMPVHIEDIAVMRLRG